MTCIHVIDDNAALRDSIVVLIENQPGWRAMEWRSGDEFLTRAPFIGPGVVLLDYSMPGASGLDVLRALKGDKRFAVVMMTGDAGVRLVVQAIQAGAVHFIEKPCDPDMMLAAIAEACDALEAGKPALEARALIARLSRRERDVFNGLLMGWQNKVIAHVLGLSPRTVEVYRSTVMDKLGVRSLSAALHIAFIAGITPKGSEPLALAA